MATLSLAIHDPDAIRSPIIEELMNGCPSEGARVPSAHGSGAQEWVGEYQERNPCGALDHRPEKSGLYPSVQRSPRE